jgi:hypothetical protein
VYRAAATIFLILNLPGAPLDIGDGHADEARQQAIAIGIALQTQVMKACPIQRQLYFDDDVNPAGAFALAIELVRTHKPFVREFEDDEHALTDLLSDTLGTAPVCCPVCCNPAKPN